MRDYWNYVKEKKGQLCYLAVVLMLLEISAALLLPHVMEQWSHDRKIGILHLILGLSMGLAGAAGMLWFLRDICIRRGMDWKKELLKCSVYYLIIQSAVGVLQGGIGMLFYQMGLADYEVTKQILYVTGGIWQNLLRMIFLLWLTGYLKGRSPEDIKEKLAEIILAAVILSVIGAGIGLFGKGSFADAIQMLWEIIYLIIAVVICGTLDRRRKYV